MKHRARIRLLSVLIAAVIGMIGLAVSPAGHAQARVVGVHEISPRITLISVYSAAMNRVIRSHVLHPAGKPAGLPSFYMLPGAGGAEDGISWYNHGGVREFFAGKRVNVVLPMGGKFSMMTNWHHRDPILGRNQWQTFYTRELPTAIDRHFRTSGVNAISGVSMSAGPALDLAIQAPRRFRAVASYSGCPGTTDPLGRLTATVVPLRGGGNPFNMWGMYDDPAWIKHDPVVNAPRLRGKTILFVRGVRPARPRRRRPRRSPRRHVRGQRGGGDLSRLHAEHVEPAQLARHPAPVQPPPRRLAQLGPVRRRHAAVVAYDRPRHRRAVAVPIDRER